MAQQKEHPQPLFWVTENGNLLHIANSICDEETQIRLAKVKLPKDLGKR